MIKSILILATLFAIAINSNADSWTQKANYGGGIRSLAVGFSIGTKGYIGTGTDASQTFYRDFWEWDQTTNAWTQMADLVGVARDYAVGFSIGTKGYIGTGVDQSASALDDFWEWDQATNVWTQKSNFGGSARHGASGFSIGNKGYIGTGADYTGNPTTDFWEWDQSTDTWTQKAPYHGTDARAFITGFSIGTKGYFGAGAWSSYYKEFWEYDQATDAWTRKNDIPGTGRGLAAGFSIGTKGYIGPGTNLFLSNDFWEWDQATDSWTPKANYGGGNNYGGAGFSIGTKGYIGTGANSSNMVQDFWEYQPDTPLPIELLSFTATPENNTYVSCNWTTASQVNNNFFAVLRSQDGINFTQIGTVPGAGNSNSILSYNYNDEHPYMGLSYYQLKQYDFNGAYSFSGIDPVYIGNITIINIYPNPSTDGYIKYMVESDIGGTATVSIINANGKEVMTETQTIKAGVTTNTVSTATLANSDYLLQIVNGKNEKTQKQFIVRAKK